MQQIYWEYTLRISLYSVQMRENASQNNSEHEHFLRSEFFKVKLDSVKS